MKTVAIIPAFNEESRIVKAINDALNFVDSVVVVDDCSSDNTFHQASETQAHILQHLINRGQGASLQTGTEFALNHLNADIIIHFDADGQMLGSEIPEIIKPLLSKEVDIVLGSRNLGKQAKNMPLSRKLTLKLSLLFTWLVSGIKTTDVHCGFRALSAEAAKKSTITLDRMAHASQIYDLIKIHDLKFTEIPVTIIYSEETLAKGMKFTSGFTVLKDFFKHKFFG